MDHPILVNKPSDLVPSSSSSAEEEGTSSAPTVVIFDVQKEVWTSLRTHLVLDVQYAHPLIIPIVIIVYSADLPNIHRYLCSKHSSRRPKASNAGQSAGAIIGRRAQ